MSNKELIKKITKEFLEKMTFKEAIIEIKEQKTPSSLIISIQVDDASQLIGQSGSNLNDLQRILRLLVAKKISTPPIFLLDINGYREKRELFLKELSREMADQVVKTKKAVMLQPMSSYERRIIHLELANKPNVATESIGEGMERRVAIRPYP